MPQMDGFSFIRELRAAARGWRDFRHSSSPPKTPNRIVEDARTAGANYYLVKPVSEADLLRYAAILAGVPA